MPEAAYAFDPAASSVLGWLTRSVSEPDPSHADQRSRERAARVSTVLLLLALLWVAGVLLLPATTPTNLAQSPLGLTLILVSVPTSLFLAYVISRSRYTWSAAAFGAGVSAVGTVVASHYEPALAAAASSFFLFAVLLTVGGLFLPLQAALTIAGINLAASVTVPHLLPQAGTAALQIPYLFLGMNAVLFLVVAPVRERDRIDLEMRYEEARAADRRAKTEADTASALRVETKSKDDLLRAATHEVRTPMTIIMLQLNVLRKSKASLSPEQEKAAEVLERNLKRLAELMDHLLDKARIDAGRLALEIKDVDLGHVFRETDDSFRNTASLWGVNLEVEPTNVRLQADPLRVSQILFNLIGNALKFTPKDGHVKVTCRREGSMVAIAVTDTGPGLSKEQIASIGTPFNQIHEPAPDRWRGAGLGLTITRALAEEHGGVLLCESAGPGKGSKFTVRLPVGGPSSVVVANAV